jgi:cell division septation protein DedD
MGRRRRGRGAATLLVILGFVTTFGGTFAAGFLSGRHWERVSVLAGLVKPQAAKDGDRAARDRVVAGRPSNSPPVPPLTFYQELTAPLAAPPPRPQKSDAKTPKEPRAPKVDANADPVKRLTARPPKAEVRAEPKADARVETAQKVRSDTRSEKVPASATSRPFTVQVAAYAGRAQAETLAQQLASRGFAADIAEATTPAGVRYRVRVGAYATKDAAREAVTRLAAETRLGGFIAAR